MDRGNLKKNIDVKPSTNPVAPSDSNQNLSSQLKSKERVFGKNARRLVKLVTQAFHNSREPPPPSIKNIRLKTPLT
jgi:hypothetical protein